MYTDQIKFKKHGITLGSLIAFQNITALILTFPYDYSLVAHLEKYLAQYLYLQETT